MKKEGRGAMNSKVDVASNVGKTYYALQGEANVSAIKRSKVVAIVAKPLFKLDITNELPCETSSLNFSDEAHVVAKSQIFEEIISSDHFVYACDGTSRQEASFLEKHIILSSGKQLPLGSEDSDTLLSTGKCVDAFREIIEVDCLDSKEDEESLLKEVIRKMKRLLSDSAAVMKAFDKKLHNFKVDLLVYENVSTHFLYCNAHFPLALSSASQEATELAEYDIVKGQDQLGRDANPKFSNFQNNYECATLRAIRTASEVFGPSCDEKSGSRQNWLALCSSKGKKSMFTSYRSNRFNCLFQNATAFLYHRQDIMDFLTDFNRHGNKKLQSVLENTTDKRILANIAVLPFSMSFRQSRTGNS